MAAPLPTTKDLITSALQTLNVMGAGESAPSGEDLEFGLRKFNGLIGQFNTRKRTMRFMRHQDFDLATAQQSYTIGSTDYGGTPDFEVSQGQRPETIQFAQLVLNNTSPPSLTPLAVVQIEQYVQIPIPALASTYPYMIYYQASWPLGVITPYPAFPTDLTNGLRLWWPDQLVTVAIADVDTELELPFGYERWIELELAVAMWLTYPKNSNLQELKAQARQARADATSNSVPPPIVSSTDGITNRSGWNWSYRSRSWI